MKKIKLKYDGEEPVSQSEFAKLRKKYLSTEAVLEETIRDLEKSVSEYKEIIALNKNREADLVERIRDLENSKLELKEKNQQLEDHKQMRNTPELRSLRLEQERKKSEIVAKMRVLVDRKHRVMASIMKEKNKQGQQSLLDEQRKLEEKIQALETEKLSLEELRQQDEDDSEPEGLTTPFTSR